MLLVGGQGFEMIPRVQTVFLDFEDLPTWDKDWPEEILKA